MSALVAFAVLCLVGLPVVAWVLRLALRVFGWTLRLALGVLLMPLWIGILLFGGIALAVPLLAPLALIWLLFSLLGSEG
ncbi:MAG: hypothetical protein QM302_08020 [Acidobacteriota bacterium]|nr:hypothetical protein [Acidobacteriota bacterium]